MTEEYLHQLWKSKRLPFHKIQPINASVIEVKNCGQHNENQKGPDFLLGEVSIDNITFYGDIEIHVKSSDWYSHKHQFDKSYNSVVLHVVYEYDKPVYQNGVLLPTMELKSHIDQQHYQDSKLGLFSTNEFPCKRLFSEMDPVYLESMKMKAYYDRLEAKTKVLMDAQLSDVEVFYHLIATAFGTSINKQGFLDLIQRIPYPALKQLKTAQQQYQLIIAESGLIQRSNNSVQSNVWHLKGTRPSNFPQIRLKQFAHFVSNYDFDTSFIMLEATQIRDEFYVLFNDFWQNNNHANKLTRSFSNSLIINAVVPFMWYIGVKNEDDQIQSKAIEILETLPAEKNKYITKWQKCSVEIKNAFDSQSLLSLYQYYCIRKKCLNCGVGIKLLED